MTDLLNNYFAVTTLGIILLATVICFTILCNSVISSFSTIVLNLLVLVQIKWLRGDQLKVFSYCTSVLNSPNIQECLTKINKKVPTLSKVIGYSGNNIANNSADS